MGSHLVPWRRSRQRRHRHHSNREASGDDRLGTSACGRSLVGVWQTHKIYIFHEESSLLFLFSAALRAPLPTGSEREDRARLPWRARRPLRTRVGRPSPSLLRLLPALLAALSSACLAPRRFLRFPASRRGATLGRRLREVCAGRRRHGWQWPSLDPAGVTMGPYLLPYRSWSVGRLASGRIAIRVAAHVNDLPLRASRTLCSPRRLSARGAPLLGGAAPKRPSKISKFSAVSSGVASCRHLKDCSWPRGRKNVRRCRWLRSVVREQLCARQTGQARWRQAP